MREIKFRGKRIDNGGWEYGFCIEMPIDGEFCYTQIANRQGWKHTVEPETVSQFTGLKDKNGREIYEGDIIRTEYGLDVATMERFPKFWLKNESFGYEGEKLQDPELCEVISSSYENPELLEEEK